MSYSPYWTMVPLTGRYIGADGEAIEGNIIFEPTPVRLQDAPGLTVVIRRPIVVTLDDQGSFKTTLPATDDPDITPIAFTWTVTEDFEGGSTFSIQVPMMFEDTGLDMANAAVVAPNTGLPISVTEEQFNALAQKVELLLGNIDGGNAYSDYIPGGGLDGGGA